MKRILFLLVLLTGQALAQEDQVDYLGLGASLLKDGYTERAGKVLEKVDVSQDGFDFARYYILKGILLNKLSYPVLSNIFIDESIKRGQENTSVFLYKARNYWLLEDYPAVIQALDKAGDAARKAPQYLIIKAESYKRQGDYDNSWKVLNEGIALFDDPAPFYRQKFHYLLELGYSQAALEYADKYLKSSGYTSKEYLAVAYTLRDNGRLEDAARLLEGAVIKYNNDEKLIELLSQVYIDQKHYSMAAQVLDWATLRHPRFAYKAAALYLKAGQPIRSLQLNRRISDQKNKFRQRLGIDIFLNDYETLVTKTSALKRYDLLKEDSIAYAVGYGYFQIGDYDKAKQYLKQISDGQLFAKASNIFQLIEKCQDEVLECY
jgi:hypothetical protein